MMHEKNKFLCSIMMDPEWSHAYKSIIDQTFEIPFYPCADGINISKKDKSGTIQKKMKCDL